MTKDTISIQNYFHIKYRDKERRGKKRNTIRSAYVPIEEVDRLQNCEIIEGAIDLIINGINIIPKEEGIWGEIVFFWEFILQDFEDSLFKGSDCYTKGYSTGTSVFRIRHIASLKRLVVSFEYEIKAKPNEIIGKSTIDYSLFGEEMLKSAKELFLKIKVLCPSCEADVQLQRIKRLQKELYAKQANHSPNSLRHGKPR